MDSSNSVMSTPVAPGSTSKSGSSPPKYVPPHRRGMALNATAIPPLEYDKRSEEFVAKSTLIGYYSIDVDRKFLNDASKMRYYSPADDMKVEIGEDRKVNLDLKEGADDAVCKDLSFTEESMSLLLEWIKLNHEKIKPITPGSEMWIRPKFVTTQGTMIKLLSSDILHDEPWVLCAAKWKGSIYLSTDKESKKREFKYDRLTKTGSWRYKFEQYILSKTPGEPPDTSKPVIESEEFRCVFQRSFGKHTVMYCAAMKGLLSTTANEELLSLDSLEFVNLETNRTVEPGKQETTFRKRKLLRWWAYCCLTNTELVLCGFRNDSGVVDKLSLFNVDMIKKTGEHFWKADECVNSCASFLAKVEQTVIRDCDENIYKFEKTSDGEMHISELPAASEYAFLPSSFLEASG